MKTLTLAALVLLLSACAATSGSGSSEMYGEIKGGVESSRTTIGR